MANNDFDKRMEFLKTSYDRLPSSFNPDEVLQKIEEETNNSGRKEPSSKKKGTFRRTMTVWAVGIASVFLFGVITAIFVLEGQENTPATKVEEYVESPEVVQEYDEYIDTLKKEYAIEREKRRKKLMLEEEKFEQLEFVRRGDSIVSVVTNKTYRESMMGIANGKERLKDHFENAVSDLKLPSEMVEDIVNYSLVDDEQASIAFLDTYRGKVQNLVAVYNEILKESSYTVESSDDKAEAFMQSRGQFPRELQNIIDTMREQSIEFYSNSDMEVIEAHYYASSLHKKIQHNFHPNTLGYVDMIVEEPYTFGGKSQYSAQELIPMLQKIERTLLTVEKDSVLYPILESYYVSSFHNMMKGAWSTRGFNEQGSIHEEFRKPLQDLASGEEATPLRYLVQPIVEELEASDWRFSKKLEMIEWEDIEEALLLGRGNQLADYMSVKQRYTKEHPVQYTLVDDRFVEKVHMLYDNFTMAYDDILLNGATGAEIIGLYYYAVELKDFETQYTLLDSATEIYGDQAIYIQNALENDQSSRKLADDFMDITFLISDDKDNDDFYFGEAVVNVKKVDYPFVEPREAFILKDTPFGWRIVVLPKG